MKTSKWYQFRQYLWLYVNSENGFSCWEKFENHNPEKVIKISEIYKEISVAEFLYSQTIFLQFTIILFHSNLDEKVTSNEQKVTSKQ